MLRLTLLLAEPSTSLIITALSVGVTGQYSLKVAEMDVTPHAGMRFTRIDMDDYTIESADFGKVGRYNIKAIKKPTMTTKNSAAQLLWLFLTLQKCLAS